MAKSTIFAITSSEWARIQANSKKFEHDNSYKENQLRKRDVSRAMTCNWKNTLASVQKQREQRRLYKIRSIEETKQREYEEIMKRKKEETERIVRQAKEFMYEERESSKRLVSALVFSAILEERRRQVEMRKKVRESEKEKRKMEELEILKKFKNEIKEDELKESLIKREKIKNYKDELDKQMTKIFQQEHNECWEKEKERLDLTHIRRELEEKAKKEKEESKRKKELLKNEQHVFFERFKEEIRKKEEKEKLEDERRYEYNKEKYELQEKIKAREKEHRIAVQKRNQLAAPPPLDLEEREGRLLEKALQEKAAILEKQDQLIAKNKAKLAHELIEAEKIAKEEALQKACLNLELKKWEAVQRVLKNEVDEELDKKEKEERRKTKETIREELNKQIEDQKMRIQAKAEQESTERKQKEEEEKRALNKYCKKIRSFAEEKNYPLFPIDKIIKDLKRENGLIPQRPMPQLTSRVPINNEA